MKLRPGLSLLVLLLLVLRAHGAPLNTNLHAYWDYEGNANNHAIAAGGATFNGTLTGGATTAGTVKIGSGALLLDGVNDYMDVTSSVNVNQAWTVSSWFRSDVAPAGSARAFVYESVNTYAISYGLREGTSTADTNFQVVLQRSGGDLLQNLPVADASTVNTWHHIVMAFTPSTATLAGSLVGYLDGLPQYSLAIPAWKLVGRVTLPVSLPALVEVFGYLFVSAMTTVSAIIFLYSSATRTASVAVVSMDDAGDPAAAAALCTLILVTSIAVRVATDLAAKRLWRRSQSWRAA